MLHRASFLETGDRPIVIIHVTHQQLLDEVACLRLRRNLRRALGGLEVILRCRSPHGIRFHADEHLRHHAMDPEIDTLPVVTLDLDGVVVQAA